jgi:hypothetical protein
LGCFANTWQRSFLGNINRSTYTGHGMAHHCHLRNLFFISRILRHFSVPSALYD